MHTPTIFLSHSAVDGAFVQEVHRHLPLGLAFLFNKSFQTGEQLISEMERGVGTARIFALFASKASLQSDGVQFEIDRARLAKLKDRNFRIHVYPVDPSISYRDYPDWMQEYWAGSAGMLPRDIARHLWRSLSLLDTAKSLVQPRVFGRGGLTDVATRDVYRQTAEVGSAPQVLSFWGLAGIGRRTFSQELLGHAYPAYPALADGPVLPLPQTCDLGDIYRVLREQVDYPFTLTEFEKSWTQFSALSQHQQIAEIASSAGHFAALGQAVTLRVGNGLFNDDGTPKSWVGEFIEALSAVPGLVTCMISNRSFDDDFVRMHPKMMQVHVQPILDDDVMSLMSSSIAELGLTPVSIPKQILAAVGGHPQVAKATVRLVKQFGAKVIDRDRHLLFRVQDEVLSENISDEALKGLQKETLSVLSWTPEMRADALFDIIEEYTGSTTDHTYYEGIRELILTALVQVNGDMYSISPALRYMFRRRYGFGSDKLIKSFAKVLKKQWEEVRNKNGTFDLSLLDNLTYMHSMEGTALPSELRGLITGATLGEVIKLVYDRARDDKALYGSVIEWGALTETIKCDPDVMEDIQSSVVRSYARTKKFKEAFEALKIMDDKGWRSRHFLRGFVLRLRREYELAIPHLRKALGERKYHKSTIHELALCLSRTGDNEGLSKLIQDNKHYIDDSALMLDFLIGHKLSEGNFIDVESIIGKLKHLPDNRGKSERRQAQVLMRRDQDNNGAVGILTLLIDRSNGPETLNRATRAIAAAYAGNYGLAKEDIEFVKHRMANGVDVAHQLMAHVFLAQKNPTEAHRELDAVSEVGPLEALLRARLYEMEASDVSMPLATRNELLDKASLLRLKNRYTTDIDLSSML